MKAEIVEREDAQVLGYMARINPMEADYAPLWEKGFDPHQKEIEALASEPAYYGVYYGTEEEGKTDFVAGMMVGEVVDVPEGLTLRDVPGGAYARFECTMSAIGPTWGAIYGQWLPSSGYTVDETRAALEYYPPDMQGPDTPVTIYVPVTQK